MQSMPLSMIGPPANSLSPLHETGVWEAPLGEVGSPLAHRGRPFGPLGISYGGRAVCLGVMTQLNTGCGLVVG